MMIGFIMVFLLSGNMVLANDKEITGGEILKSLYEVENELILTDGNLNNQTDESKAVLHYSYFIDVLMPF